MNSLSCSHYPTRSQELLPSNRVGFSWLLIRLNLHEKMLINFNMITLFGVLLCYIDNDYCINKVFWNTSCGVVLPRTTRAKDGFQLFAIISWFAALRRRNHHFEMFQRVGYMFYYTIRYALTCLADSKNMAFDRCISTKHRFRSNARLTWKFSKMVVPPQIKANHPF